jgi:hypothetical protein
VRPSIVGTRVLALASMAIVSLVLLPGCSGNDGRAGPRSSTVKPPASLPSSGEIKVVDSGRRPEPPDGMKVEVVLPGEVAEVPAVVETAWSPAAWGPDRAFGGSGSKGIPDGASAIVLWAGAPSAGWKYKFQSIDLEGEVLVIRGTRSRPGAGCAAARMRDGTSFLLAVAGTSLRPGTSVRVDLEETSYPCNAGSTPEP